MFAEGATQAACAGIRRSIVLCIGAVVPMPFLSYPLGGGIEAVCLVGSTSADKTGSLSMNKSWKSWIIGGQAAEASTEGRGRPDHSVLPAGRWAGRALLPAR